MTEWTRLTCPVLREEYQVDYEEELKLDMLAHNARCSLNIINNPEKFPRADMDRVWRNFEAHQTYLATRGVIV